jgi:thymidylate kinase
VLFDRYHGDLLVDPRRYRYGGPMWLARLACRLMPQPDRVIFLDAEPVVLLSRKQEIDEASLARSRSGYVSLCATHPRFETIDASRPLDEVAALVMEIIPSAAGTAKDRA